MGSLNLIWNGRFSMPFAASDTAPWKWFVHDAKVVQVVRTEKVRIDSPARRPPGRHRGSQTNHSIRPDNRRVHMRRTSQCVRRLSGGPPPGLRLTLFLTTSAAAQQPPADPQSEIEQLASKIEELDQQLARAAAQARDRQRAGR